MPSKLRQPSARALFDDLRPPHLNPDGTIRHPDRIASSTWRDPDDAVAMERDERGRAHQRTIAGYRVIDPLSRLPCDPEHHRAARKLRVDWERGSGATSGGSDAGRVDNGNGDRDSLAAQMDARRKYEDAVQAVGARASVYLLPVVLCGWTVADLLAKHGGNPMALQGRVMAALDRLVDHYFGGRATTALEAAPWLIGAVDVLQHVPLDVPLPSERLGRFRRPAARR